MGLNGIIVPRRYSLNSCRDTGQSSNRMYEDGTVVAILYEDNSDKHIHPLTAISINLKRATPIEIPLYLYQAQMRANELWQINFQLIDGKNGFVRGAVMGGEFNQSGHLLR